MRKIFNSIVTMRKSMATLAAILFWAVATTTALTACGGGDGDDNNGSGGSGQTTPTAKLATAALELSIVQTEGFLSYFDMYVEYNEGGIAKTDTLSSNGWLKSFTVDLPGAFTLKEFVKQKTNTDLSADTTKVRYYTPNGGYLCKYTLKDAKGAAIKSGYIHGESQVKTSLAKAKDLASYVADKKFDKTLTITFDASGDYSSSSWK